MEADAAQLRREAMTWTIRYVVYGIAGHAVEVAEASALQTRADEAVLVGLSLISTLLFYYQNTT
jgi:hypothetical protein